MVLKLVLTLVVVVASLLLLRFIQELQGLLTEEGD